MSRDCATASSDRVRSCLGKKKSFLFVQALYDSQGLTKFKMCRLGRLFCFLPVVTNSTLLPSTLPGYLRQSLLSAHLTLFPLSLRLGTLLICRVQSQKRVPVKVSSRLEDISLLVNIHGIESFVHLFSMGIGSRGEEVFVQQVGS